jgi:D-glycero-alpha-D-manno-heptose 1-phosphate guanylyltransferase
VTEEAIILAGGMGTRLRKLVSGIPKPMAPVNGRPFIFYILRWLEGNGIRKAIISAGYKSEAITDYFGDKFGNMELRYAIEEKPLGTGGAVMFALGKTDADNVLILNGDTWFPIDLKIFSSFHTRSRNAFSLALKRMENFSRYGTVECTGDKIFRFNEKKFCSSGLINGGIYLASRKFLDSRKLPEVFSLETDFLEKEAANGDLKCKAFDALFIDIGIPEDYVKASALLT